MPATPDAIAERLQGTPGASGFDGIRAKCLGDSILELLQGASEDLAARLELRPQSKKAEAVVAGDVEAGDELVEKHVELAPRIAGKAAEPGIERLRRAVIHDRTTLTRGRLCRRVANVPCAHQAANPGALPRNPS